MNVYFGEHWGVPALEGAQQVPAPVGSACLHCREAIVDGDRGFVRLVMRGEGEPVHSSPVHAECEALTVAGHLFGVCSCTGFDTSSREAARELWRRMGNDQPIGAGEITQPCPSCGQSVTMQPYDIGSGPEMACPGCEWCWGAAGQPLKPYRPDVEGIFP